MRRFLLLGLLSALAAAILAAPSVGTGIGPPSGTIYAFDQAYNTVATPTSLPNRGPFDTIYVFPDCSSCASVSEGRARPSWLQRGPLASRAGLRDHDPADERRRRRRASHGPRRHGHALRLSAQPS